MLSLSINGNMTYPNSVPYYSIIHWDTTEGNFAKHTGVYNTLPTSRLTHYIGQCLWYSSIYLSHFTVTATEISVVRHWHASWIDYVLIHNIAIVLFQVLYMSNQRLYKIYSSNSISPLISFITNTCWHRGVTFTQI